MKQIMTDQEYQEQINQDTINCGNFYNNLVSRL